MTSITKSMNMSGSARLSPEHKPTLTRISGTDSISTDRSTEMVDVRTFRSNCTGTMESKYEEHKLEVGDLTRYTHKMKSNGTQSWCKDGKLHRDGDLPAEIMSDGTQLWYKDGKKHRDGDLPAMISADGTQCWYKNDEVHRDGDLPAMIMPNGRQCWYNNGVRHRDGYLPAVMRVDGTQEWYKNGERQLDR